MNIMNSSRKLFLGMGAVSMMAATSGATTLDVVPEGKSLPNIVMILSDDQGWGDYGFMGHKVIQTPNLDRLAASSRVFTRGYVVAPVCGPSLASIITGLHPHQHGKISNDPPQVGEMTGWRTSEWSKERRQLSEQTISNFSKYPTIPKELKELGYSSLQTGKWWMGNYRTGGFTHGMTHGDMDKEGRHGDEGLKIGRETMQPLYDFIDESNENPFFIWYAPFLPHTPHNPPERLLSKYRDKTESIHVARYWAMCEWFDETCGELLGYLDEKGISDNTIVLYVCDNGWIQQPDNGGKYAERSKGSLYEGGIRTPIMIKWPGHVTSGFDETTLVSSIDFAPTVLNVCGLTPTADMQGVDLLDSQSLRKRDAIFGVAYTRFADINNPSASIRYSYVIEGEWKLILPSGRNDTGTEPELYHVSEDPHEKINLAGSNPEKVKHMKQLLKEWWSKTVD